MKKTSKKVILYRIDGLDQQAAVLDGRLDALQPAVSGLAKRVADLAQEAADLELIRKRIEELEEEQRAALAEFRARITALERWTLAAGGGCSTLRRIPTPTDGAVIDPYAVKAAGADK